MELSKTKRDLSKVYYLFNILTIYIKSEIIEFFVIWLNKTSIRKKIG